MNSLSTLSNYAVLALIAVAFVGIAAGCLVLITRNVREGRIVREKLAKQMESSRMSSALHLFNVDFREYLHTVPVIKILENINHCDECASPWCKDDSSTHPAVRESNFYFCPVTNHLTNKSRTD